jgi:hypothetical protein
MNNDKLLNSFDFSFAGSSVEPSIKRPYPIFMEIGTALLALISGRIIKPTGYEKIELK